PHGFRSEPIAQFGVSFGMSRGAQLQFCLASERGHAPLLQRVALFLDQRRVSSQGFADFIILSLHDPLQSFDLVADGMMLDRLVRRGGADFRRDQPVNAEARHQVVFKADEETRRARVALPAGAPAKLVVYAPALVTIGSDDVKPAEFNDAFPI